MTGKSSKDLPNMTALAEQMGLSDSPRFQVLKQILQMQNQNSDSEDRANRARRKRAQEQRAFALLQERNREFAAACGACPCFGEYRRCEICAGQGRSGWQAPDEELFLEYIGPTLKMLGILGPNDDQNQAPIPDIPENCSGDVHYKEVSDE